MSLLVVLVCETWSSDSWLFWTIMIKTMSMLLFMVPCQK